MRRNINSRRVEDNHAALSLDLDGITIEQTQEVINGNLPHVFIKTNVANTVVTIVPLVVLYHEAARRLAGHLVRLAYASLPMEDDYFRDYLGFAAIIRAFQRLETSMHSDIDHRVELSHLAHLLALLDEMERLLDIGTCSLVVC